MTEPDWGALRSAIAGAVFVAGEPGYDGARRPAIANFHDVLPQAVVRCDGPADVTETLAFAHRFALPLAPRSGGHCFAGRSSTQGIVVDVTPMCSVSVSGAVATVGAGTRLGQLYDALAGHGVTVSAGCGPTVGIAGLVLGGGLGVLGRAYGLTSDGLIGAEVVLADGRTVHCDGRREPELFWALRGAGGGRFGVVTSLTFATVAAPTMTGFHLTWLHSEATQVIGAWQAWAPAAPDEIAASLVVRAAGETDQPPAVHVFGATVGSRSDAMTLLDAFAVRIDADPTATVVHEAPHREAKRWLANLFPGDEGEPQLHSKSEYFEHQLPVDAIEELVARLGDRRPAGETRTLDFSPWGGAYNRVDSDATAFAHRRARFLLKHEVVTTPARRDSGRQWLRSSWSVTHPCGTGGVYPNFPDADLDDWDPAYHGANRDRLLRAKTTYDPDGRFGQVGRASR